MMTDGLGLYLEDLLGEEGLERIKRGGFPDRDAMTEWKATIPLTRALTQGIFIVKKSTEEDFKNPSNKEISAVLDIAGIAITLINAALNPKPPEDAE